MMSDLNAHQLQVPNSEGNDENVKMPAVRAIEQTIMCRKHAKQVDATVGNGFLSSPSAHHCSNCTPARNKGHLHWAKLNTKWRRGSDDSTSARTARTTRSIEERFSRVALQWCQVWEDFFISPGTCSVVLCYYGHATLPQLRPLRTLIENESSSANKASNF